MADCSELVRQLLQDLPDSAKGDYLVPVSLVRDTADALTRLKRELAACEGALRNSGNMVRDLNDLAKSYENELTVNSHAKMKAALEEIARQKKLDELDGEEVENADFEGAYDMMIDKARAVLAGEEPSRDLEAARREAAAAWTRCQELRKETYSLCVERDNARQREANIAQNCNDMQHRYAEELDNLGSQLEAARRQIEELRVSRAKILGEGIMAIEERDAARRVNAELRERDISGREWTPTHQHLKTGGLYRVIGSARIEKDWTPVIVYQHQGTNSLWVRPDEEFNDGRFCALAKPEHKEGISMTETIMNQDEKKFWDAADK